MNISKEILIKNGYVESYDRGFGDFGNFYMYTKYINDKCITIKSVSNMIDRDWSIHIDNDDCDTIASIDVQTIEHLNTVFELMDMNERIL